MNPTTPTYLGSAMSQGGTFIRRGAGGWGPWDGPQPAVDQTTPTAIEHALAAAVKDPDRVTELLDELSRGRLWVPLPEDRPVTDGSAVLLPTVTYLGAEFVPAFTSVRELASWVRVSPGDGPFAAMPHIVVLAADLARRLPTAVGIALNPGGAASVPIYPEGVGYLAANPVPHVVVDGAQVRVGRPPAEPTTLLREIQTGLGSVPEVWQASTAWLSVPGRGEGLIISVTLEDPARESAREQVVTAIERAVRATPEQGFPIDVTFPGEGLPDQVDTWISTYAEPFYSRTPDAASGVLEVEAEA
jgi:hypothetical protein